MANVFGYARKEGADWRQYDLLWPLAAYRTSKDDTHSRLLPLWWHRKRAGRETHLLCPPLFVKRKTNQRTSLVSFPLIWYGRRHDDHADRRSFVLFPLLWDRHDRRHDSRTSTLFPLVWREYKRGGEQRSLLVLPVLWSHTGRNVRALHVWPLFGWNRGSRYREASTLWPLFRYSWRTKGERKELWAPWPLVNLKTDPAREFHHLRVVPFWSTRRKDKRLTAILPLVWLRREKGFSGSSTLWYADRPRDKSIDRQHVVLWKLLTYEHRTTGDYDFRVLHKLIRLRREQGYSEFALNPLARSEQDADVRRLSLLGPVLQYEGVPTRKQIRILHFIRIPISGK